jgi:hypothetical protein
MTEAAATAPPQAQSPAKEALLPDGIGLTLEQAKTLISQTSGIVLGNDEPALMGITVCNAYLGEVQKLQNSMSGMKRALPG